MHYELGFEDFRRVFNFAINYYFDTTISSLGAVLDALTSRNITAIGVEKLLRINNPNKYYILDFDIKSDSSVKDKSDIIGIVEYGVMREPNLFIKIKNISKDSEWIGLSEEQFNNIKKNSNSKKVYIIYTSLVSNTRNNNPKTADLTGMFLKEIENREKSEIFQRFSSLNARCKIEFIISFRNFEKFAYLFEKGMGIFKTNPFQEKKRTSFYYKNRNKIKKDILEIQEFIDFNGTKELTLSYDRRVKKREISEFEIRGSFKILKKKSTSYIECLSDVYLENRVFGNFKLEREKFYSFNLSMVGRGSKIKENTLLISKNRMFEIANRGLIQTPQEIIKKIALEI